MKNKKDYIIEKYKEAFEALENYDKTGKLELKPKRKKKSKHLPSKPLK